MRSFNRQNKEAGFNLIEAAIVLGIVGLVVAGIWAAASAAYENMRQQSSSRNLLAMAQNIKNFYANSGLSQLPAAAITATALIQNGLVPREFIANANTNIVHPWGSPGAANTISVSSPAGVAGTFVISFSAPAGGVTTNDWVRICNNLISRNANAATGSGLQWGLTAAGATNIPPLTGNPGCTALTNVPSFRFPIQ